jgi:DNA repair photolyase
MKNMFDVHTTSLTKGIGRTKEFEKKGLARYSVNVGTKCSHGCSYCSSASLLRMHSSFKAAKKSPFEDGYAIIDPEIASKVAYNAKHTWNRGQVMLCTTVDAWCPAAQKYNLGRKCLEAILAEPGWTVRILTKNAAVVDDFDIIEKYRSRVILGLSITSTNDKISSIIEPNASSITERMKALKLARAKGIRVYSMLCPLIAGIANSRAVIDELVQFGEEIGSEEFFAETVNRRGKALPNTQNVLAENDFAKEAKAVEAIRQKAGWSEYAVELIRDVQASMRKYSDIDKLKFLLYPSNLLPEDEAQIKKDDKGVVWL